MMLIILINLLNCCQSLPDRHNVNFPDPIRDNKSVVIYDETNDIVSMPLWYWLQIVEYGIDTK